MASRVTHLRSVRRLHHSGHWEDGGSGGAELCDKGWARHRRMWRCDVMCVGGRCCVVLTLWWDKLRVMWLPPPRAHHDVVMTYEVRDRFFIHLQGKLLNKWVMTCNFYLLHICYCQENSLSPSRSLALPCERMRTRPPHYFRVVADSGVRRIISDGKCWISTRSDSGSGPGRSRLGPLSRGSSSRL